MARIERFRLPDLGEGLPDGEIIRWLVAEGDHVAVNQPIAEIETAKAVVELPAKWAGTVVKLCESQGATVAVGTPIIEIDTGEPGGSPPAREPGSTPAAAWAPGTPAERPEVEPAERIPVLVGYGPKVGTGSSRPGPARPLAKPPVRKLARELGVDLSQVAGTGPQGSITRDDLVRHVPGSGRIEVRGVRKRTAEAVTESALTTPHVTEFLTVDVTRSIRALGRLRDSTSTTWAKCSPLLIVAKAVLTTLPRHPLINASWRGDHIALSDSVHLSLAVATERGLIVPTIANAGQLSVRELAAVMDEVVDEARRGKTPPQRLTGGTFTITNIGVFGVDAGTPITPPGQAAILAIGAIRKAPWVHNGKIKIRNVLTLALSFDHRMIDGEQGSLFLKEVGDFLTDPELALLRWG